MVLLKSPAAPLCGISTSFRQAGCRESYVVKNAVFLICSLTPQPRCAGSLLRFDRLSAGNALAGQFKKLLTVFTILAIITGFFFPNTALAISVKEEKDLSREFLKVIFAQYQRIQDPAIADYVSDIGQKIVSVYPPQPFPYHFYVIKEHSYNAFASPAGHIFINSGLIEVMAGEEELAGVLAHEIAHVYCRHISQKIERSQKIGVATLAGVVAGVLLGSSGAGAAANAVTIGTLAAGQSAALAYSRDDEAQADQVGLKYLNRAGYSAKGLLTVLNKMRSQQWFGPNQIPTYLRTHPASEDRMANIDLWLENHEKVHPHIDPYPFNRTHTWLIAVYGDEKASLKRFASMVDKNPEDPLAHYGYGLILARTNDWEDAIGQLKAALHKKAFDPYILIDLGRVYFLDGRYPEALNILQSAESIAPDNPGRLYWFGRTQQNMGLLDQAATTFEKVISINADHSQAYYFLGETCSKLGRTSDSHYYLGIYYKTLSRFKNAVFHLNKAMESMRDPDKRSKIEQMLAEIRKEEKMSPKQEKP